MKRRNFLGLAGQSLALVAAAPALAPLATAAPVNTSLPTDYARKLATGYGANPYRWVENPPLVISDDGKRLHMLRSAMQQLGDRMDADVYRELKLSIPFDLSSATCEPAHTPGEAPCSET